jgi:hypothetical protein
VIDRGLSRTLLVLAVAVVTAASLVGAAPLAREVLAATPDLTVVGAARYDVEPAAKRVRITVDLVATNHLKDSATQRFYFDRAFLQVQPGTRGYRLTSSSGSPSVSISRRLADSTILQLNFGRRLFSGETAKFQLRFDLPDPGGAPGRDVRIGGSLVTFPAWGFGSTDTPGGTVTVTFPTGYTIDVFAGPFGPPRTVNGSVTYSTAPLANASRFSSFFVADRAAAYVETKASAQIAAERIPFTVRAWPDDAAWGKRVASLFSRGLPITAGSVGLPWRMTAPLVVQEGVSRTTGGYAGLFDPASGKIDVAYYADTFVIIHESVHSWFNGSLLQDRWANEAFASYYADQTAKQLGESVSPPLLTDALRKSRIALNDWSGVGTEQPAREDYAYAASLALANEIAKRAGQDGLRAVWSAAAERRAAYQPVGSDGAAPVERAEAPPDWRGLLDSLEDATGKRFDDLWRTWVVRDSEKSLLDERAKARAAYTELVATAATWQLPGSVRAAMRAWQFDQAMTQMREARAILDRRAALESAARDAGVHLPGRLQAAFESADGVAAANAEADAELATMTAITAARDAKPAGTGPLEQLGLFGQSPDAKLDAARAAFSGGDLEAAARDASAAHSAWSDAAFTGINRLLVGVAVLLLVLLLVAVISTRRRSRRRLLVEHRDVGL